LSKAVVINVNYVGGYRSFKKMYPRSVLPLIKIVELGYRCFIEKKILENMEGTTGVFNKA
jgi:hypothetical protein